MRTTAPVRITRHGYTYVRLPDANPHGGLCQLEIDPNVQEGYPCIRGTRIPASSIAACYDGTKARIKYVCDAWGVTEKQVKACAEYINAPLRRE